MTLTGPALATGIILLVAGAAVLLHCMFARNVRTGGGRQVILGSGLLFAAYLAPVVITAITT